MNWNLKKKNNKVCLLLGNYLESQTSPNPFTLQKYWYYKNRLNNDYVKVGLNQDDSIPFQERLFGEFGYQTGATAPLDQKVGDATSKIGIYI